MSVLLFAQACFDLGPSTSGDGSNIIDPGIIEREDGKSERFVTPPVSTAPSRLDNSFLDQYFSNYGLCEIRLRSCPSGHVLIPDGTDDYFDFQFFDLSHGACIEKALEYEESCELKDEIIVSFKSPYDRVVSSTTIGGVELFSNGMYTCEMEFSSCLNGGAYAKFNIFHDDRVDAVKECLDFTSERVKGCAGGVLKKINVNSIFGFDFTHVHHDINNQQVLNTCQGDDQTIDIVVDFKRYLQNKSSSTGFQFGLDFANNTNRLVDVQTNNFQEYAIRPLGMNFYRTSAAEKYQTIVINNALYQSDFQIQSLMGGSPDQYLPVGADSGTDLNNGLPLYTFGSGGADPGFNAFQRLLNGEAGKGGLAVNIANMLDHTFYPSNGTFVVEPWDAPDYVFQDNLRDTFLCPNNAKAGCDYHYGDEIAAPWKGGGFINASLATPNQIADYTYSAHETYVQIFQQVTNNVNLKSVEFAGPSIMKFSKTYLINFLDYCLGRQALIKAGDVGKRGCEVNYISWHGSDYYEDQMSQLVRDVEWVREEIINNTKYDPLKIKGITITDMHGKRDFFVPAAALRQILYQESAEVDFGGRACWFRSCENENSLGALLNFDSSGFDFVTSYEKSNMWWTYQFYNESKVNRVRSYSLQDKMAVIASSRGHSTHPEMWIGSHLRDGKKKNYRILLRNLDLLVGFKDDDTNLTISHRNLPAEYFDLWNSAEALDTEFDPFSPKTRGPSINEATDLVFKKVLELPVEKSEVELCIPDQVDGDLNHFKIEFTEIK